MHLQRPNPNNDLVQRLLPAVERMARSQSRRHPHADLEELVQAGMLGLMEAARNHAGDAACAEGFAIRRIRGAMLDFLRGQDPLTRRQRKAVRAIEAARQRVGQRVAQEPRASQVAADAGVSLEDYARIALDAATQKREIETEELGSGTPDALTLLQARRRREAVSAALAELDPRLQTLLLSHYAEDRPFGELSERFGISAGRVSQLHKQALDRLRRALDPAELN